MRVHGLGCRVQSLGVGGLEGFGYDVSRIWVWGLGLGIAG